MAWAMESAKHLGLWREALPDVVVPRASFFVSLPSCVAFRRGAPAFVVLGQLFPAKGLQSGPGAQGERFAEVQRAELPGVP